MILPVWCRMAGAVEVEAAAGGLWGLVTGLNPSQELLAASTTLMAPALRVSTAWTSIDSHAATSHEQCYEACLAHKPCNMWLWCTAMHNKQSLTLLLVLLHCLGATMHSIRRHMGLLEWLENFVVYFK